MAIHRLLMRGLQKIAPSNGTAVVEYLVEDPRRLAVSESGYDLEDSRQLLECLGPAVSESEVERLVAAIESWSFWMEPFDEERRAIREEQNREDRLKLFAALPAAKIPKRIVAQLGSFIPTPSRKTMDVFGGAVRSPIAAAQFAKSTEEEVLGTLAEYPDSREPARERRNPTGFPLGSGFRCLGRRLVPAVEKKSFRRREREKD